MPAVGDLERVGQRFGRSLAVAAAAVARHDPDLRVRREPSPHRCSLAVGQQRHDPPPLQIADDRSVAMVLAEGPVINTGNDKGLGRRAGPSPDDPQQGIVTHGQHQPLGEICRRPAAQRQTQMMNNAFQPCRPAGSDRESGAEPLGKDLPTTVRDLAGKPPSDHQENHLPAGAGQIRDLSGVPAMNSARRGAEPHNGHLAATSADRTVKIRASDESLTLSTANPLGTRDEIRSPVRMALIPPLENRKVASRNHRK